MRELNHYNNFPLNYIIRAVCLRIDICIKKFVHVFYPSPDIKWINIYRKEINREINLRLDPTSSILSDYNFINDSREIVDGQKVDILVDFLIYSNKRWGYICNKCSFAHPRLSFEYRKFLEIYPFINYITYKFLINNCL